MNKRIQKILLAAQRNEATEYAIYSKLATITHKASDKKILKEISEDETHHYEFFKKHTGTDMSPQAVKVWLFFWISRIFGLNFGVKLMERAEQNAQIDYAQLKGHIEGVEKIIEDEEKHEQEVLKLLSTDRLRYLGSIVLGLNDAIVELTGALAGLTFALQDTKIIAVVGLITGIAAALSMAVSEYLSTKHDNGNADEKIAALYTGVAYACAVAILIAPFWLVGNVFMAMGLTVLNAIFIILIFTFYTAIAKDLPFWKRFLEMAGLSLSVATLSFLVGLLVRKYVEL